MFRLEDKEAISFLNVIYDINQEFKNVPESDSIYLFKKNQVKSYNEDQLGGYTGTLLKNKKQSEYVDLLKDHNVELFMNGKEFFQFCKAYKKNITSIEYADQQLIIGTNLPDVFFKTLDYSTSIDYVNKSNAYFKRINSLRKNRCIESFTNFNLSFEDYTEHIKDKKVVVTIYFNLDSNEILFNKEDLDSKNYLPFKFNEKYFMKVDKNTECSFSLDLLKSRFYILEFHLVNPKHDIKQYLYLANYEK